MIDFRKGKKCFSIVIFLFMALLSGCMKTGSIDQKERVIFPEKEWKTSSPESQGVYSDKLDALAHDIIDNNRKVHSILLIRNGIMITDMNFYPYDGTSLHDIASDTKSIMSLLIGMAINMKIIKNENQYVLDLLKKPRNKTERIGSMTVKHLLTMTSGFQCIHENDKSPFRESTLMKMLNSDDWIDYVINLPVVDKPGDKFDYNSCNYHLLSAIIREQSGISAGEFAKRYLFEPLGIENFIWPEDNRKISYGWGDLKLHPHDMAKIGLFLMNNGNWNGKQLLPSDWVKKSLSISKKALPYDGYGYGWWIISAKYGIYGASGRSGQYILIWPAMNSVVVITGSDVDLGAVASLLLPAFSRSMTLPENLESNDRLLKTIESARLIPPPGSVAPFPKTAFMVSEKKWILSENELGLKKVIFIFNNDRSGKIMINSDISGMNTDINAMIRFDGYYGVSYEGQYGLPVAAKGKWLSENELTIDICDIGKSNNFTVNAVFNDASIVLKVNEKTLLSKELTIKGNIKQN